MVPTPAADNTPRPIPAPRVHDDRQRRRVRELRAGRDERQGQEPDPDARGVVSVPAARAPPDAAGVSVRYRHPSPSTVDL